MAGKSKNQEYTWTVDDYITLNNRLDRIESSASQVKDDIKDIKEDLAIKNHIVVDNRSKTDWKAIGVIIGATIAAILAAIQQVSSR